jgi:hypothetical protein
VTNQRKLQIHLEALAWHVRVAWRRRAMPFAELVRSVEGPLRPAAGPRVPVERLYAALCRARRLWPGPRSCLMDSLAAVGLFREHGHDARLAIGVRAARPAVDAHAWVIVEGRAFGQGTAGYAPLRASDSAIHAAAAVACWEPSRTESE